MVDSSGAPAAVRRAPPRVSVIVPVRNRRALLRKLLDGLAEQTFPDLEVIVVDDGSTDGTAQEAEKDACEGRPVRVIQNTGVGAYAGRRAGVAASDAPFLAFTDSDCVPVPGWLEAGVAALDSGADVVNGDTRPARPLAALERSMWSGEEGLYPTCNVFYRREAYDRAGGFDEAAADRFGFPPGSTARRMGFGEDTLLGWRVRRAGTAVHAPDALVHHEVLPPNLADRFRRTWMMVAFPALFREVPELRSGPLVRHRYVLNTPDRFPVYATAAALLTRRRATAAATAAWWAVARVRDVRGGPGTRAAKLTSLPAQVALDALTTGALVVGSVRFRTVVL